MDNSKILSKKIIKPVNINSTKNNKIKLETPKNEQIKIVNKYKELHPLSIVTIL